MTRQFFVDETKQRGYQMVLVAAGTAEQVDDLRKLMRGLVLKGQRRVHMKKENDSRRRAIAAAICGSGVTATVFDAGRRYPRELDAREACLRQIVAELAGQPDLLVLEQDDSLLDWDRRCLYDLTRNAKAEGLRYEHRRAAAEALLALPDAIAWCWAKGGDWRRRIEPVVLGVREV
jgi:hypothetical protein